jgi:hypothetical protein
MKKWDARELDKVTMTCGPNLQALPAASLRARISSRLWFIWSNELEADKDVLRDNTRVETRIND